MSCPSNSDPSSSPKEAVAAKTLILCDFDGTVSIKDTVNRLIRSHISDPYWRYYVKRYLRGEIGSREVYKAVAPMMRMTRPEFERFVLEHAELDPFFPRFLIWARDNNIDVKIVSDGFDETIRTLFESHGVTELDIISNTLLIGEDGKIEIRSDHFNPACGTCGTCKLNVLRNFRSQYDKIVLIGDGESDRHAATEADMVLALGDLFLFCARNGIPAIRIDGFHEAPIMLSREIRAVAFDLDGTLIDSIEAIVEAFNYMFSELGYPSMTVQEILRRTSISLVDFVKSHLKPEHGELGIKVFRDYYDTIYLERTTMLPGAMEAVLKLNGSVKQGIVSNKRGRYARILAEHLGFAHKMVKIIGAEDGFKAKPAADMFHEFMRHVGSTEQDTIYVGDAPIDIEGAYAAGVDAYAVAGEFFTAEELALLKPRRVLSNIGELPQALESVITTSVKKYKH
jgi:2,3-diketo-5-methylthio-1-phosphopentane phosphatase